MTCGGTALAAPPRYHASQVPLATFDLADFAGPRLVAGTSDRPLERRFLAPEIGAPPGAAKKPARFRIRGRKVKFRVPLG